jgi:hypothetical protein
MLLCRRNLENESTRWLFYDTILLDGQMTYDDYNDKFEGKQEEAYHITLSLYSPV